MNPNPKFISIVSKPVRVILSKYLFWNCPLPISPKSQLNLSINQLTGKWVARFSSTELVLIIISRICLLSYSLYNLVTWLVN